MIGGGGGEGLNAGSSRISTRLVSGSGGGQMTRFSRPRRSSMSVMCALIWLDRNYKTSFAVHDDTINCGTGFFRHECLGA